MTQSQQLGSNLPSQQGHTLMMVQDRLPIPSPSIPSAFPTSANPTHECVPHTHKPEQTDLVTRATNKFKSELGFLCISRGRLITDISESCAPLPQAHGGQQRTSLQVKCSPGKCLRRICQILITSVPFCALSVLQTFV